MTGLHIRTEEKCQLADFARDILSTYGDEKARYMLARYLEQRFRDRNTWSGRTIDVTYGSFRTERAYLRYTISGGREYGRNFHTTDIERFYEFCKTTQPIQAMAKRQLQDEKEYNSIQTMTDDNIVVIKYANCPDGYSTLLSMTVGEYYIAKKFTDMCGRRVYQLLMHDAFERSSTSPICVLPDSGNNKRFEEYKIDGWIDEYDFRKQKAMLKPVFTPASHMSARALNPITGEIELTYNNFVVSAQATNDQIEHNMGHTPGFQYLTRSRYTYNDSTKAYVDTKVQKIINSGLGSMDANGCLLVNMEAAGDDRALMASQKAWYDYVNARELDKAVKLQANSIYGAFGANIEIKVYDETDEEMEARLNREAVPVRKHSVDASMGVNDDYLLL